MVSGGDVEAGCGFMEGASGLRGRDVSDCAGKASVVEPIDPPEGLPFDGGDGLPRRATVDHLGLDQADDRLREGIVVAVADGSDGRLDPCIGAPLGVAQRQV